MSNLLLPLTTLPGLTWDFTLTPLWSAGVQTSTSGREVRTTYFTSPIWEIVITFNYLRGYIVGGDGFNEMARLVGFFNQHQGGAQSFLLNLTNVTRNNADSVVAGQQIGIGDGATKDFQLVRNYGGFLEPIQEPLNQLATVKVNGATKVQGTDYTIALGVVTFVVAPAAAAVITADFTALWRVRFNTPDVSALGSQSSGPVTLQNFIFSIWKVNNISLITVKQ